MSEGTKQGKVLFIVNSLAGGGAERVCAYLANAMKSAFEVDLVTLYEDASPLNPEGMHVLSLGLTKDAGKMAKITQLAFACRKLNSFIANREKSGEYKLITAHLTASHVLSALSCVADRCLYVQHSLPSAIEASYSAPVLNRLIEVYRRGQSISVSEGVRQQMIEHFRVHADRIKTVYNCVPTEYIYDGMGKPISQKRPYILCVGRLAQSKRFDRMITVYVKGGFAKEFDLVFLGQGSLRDELRSQAEAAGVGESVHFVGYVDNPYAWMNKSSVMVMTSDREALPTVLVEGLIAGAHVVSSDCDFGPREILTGELSSFLVPPDSIDGYVEAIKNAIERYPVLDGDYFARYRADEVMRRYFERYRLAILDNEEI